MIDHELNVAIVGLGYWGPNILRTAYELEDVHVTTLCDRSPDALAKQARRYPSVHLTHEIDSVLEDDSIDAVFVVTPISTHYSLAKRCLEAGKHVFVEKPLAESAEECDELIDLAEERGLVLMPGHTFVYSPPVNVVKELLDSGEIGEVFFGTSSRVNLGIHQSDVSVIRDLAPHDFSMMLHWFGEPSWVRAVARDAIVPGIMDVAFIDMGYPNGALIHLELSWLSPTKLRRTVLVGREKMVVYEDTSQEQVRIFDRSVEVIDPQNFGEHRLSYRSGDIVSPRIDADEPLRLEVQDFVEAIRDGRQPRSHMYLGRDVVRLIEATEASLAFNGAPASLAAPPKDRRAQPDRRRNISGMPALSSLDLRTA